jgi:hypothetical protein
MTNTTPGRVLWCLRRKRSDVRCVLLTEAMPFEVHVLQDMDVVLRERFPEEQSALTWAAAYAERLKQHGWREHPNETPPPVSA